MAKRNLENYMKSGLKRANESNINISVHEINSVIDQCKGNPVSIALSCLCIGVEAGYRMATNKHSAVAYECEGHNK